MRFRGDKSKADAIYAYASHTPLFLMNLEADSVINSGCEPLTPEDIAEIVVFAAGRRENVVLADTLVYPSHQAGVNSMHKRTDM